MTITMMTGMTWTTKYFFFKSIKCHTFSESQAQVDWNDHNSKDNKNDKVKYHRIYKDDNDDYNT